MSGWIKLHRSMLDWEWYGDANVVRVFLHLLLNANHKEKRWKGEIVPAGSLITGRDSLAEQTGLSVQQVRTALNKLKSTGEITIKNRSKYSITSITCWHEYQSINQQDNQQSTSNQPAINQQVTTNKNVKKERSNTYTSESVDSDGFDVFWGLYPRKENKKKAESKWSRMKQKDRDSAISDVPVRYLGVDRQYVPMPTTYLNGERWNDELVTGGANGKGGRQGYASRNESPVERVRRATAEQAARLRGGAIDSAGYEVLGEDD